MNSIGPFYDYFIKKHGIEVFNEISNSILSKIKDIKQPIKKQIKREEFLKIYVIFIFEVAITDYWGMNNDEIKRYIKLTMGENVVNDFSITRAKKIHGNSIHLIQKYLKQTTNEVMEELLNE